MSAEGISTIILAIATLLTSLGGFIIMLRKTAATHLLVNSNMEQLKAAIADASFKAGEDQERAQPTAPK